MNLLRDKNFIGFVAKFLLIFALCYFGSLAVIGLSAKDGYYSPFVDQYLDFISFITVTLLQGTKFLLSIFDIETYRAPNFVIRIVNGKGVQIAYDCVGYGVMSFWTAYVLATRSAIRKKIPWLFGGLFALWFINVIRITLFLVAHNRGWPMPLGIDHHTWFNIAAYLLIFIMIYLFEKKQNPVNRKGRSAVHFESTKNLNDSI